MVNAQVKDLTAAVNEAIAALPIDTKAFEDAYQAATAMNEKLSGAALGAVEKSNQITIAATKETLAALAEVGKAKAEPADYTKAVADFSTFAAEQVAKNLSVYAEITRTAQSEAVELLVAAGKDATNDAVAVAKKAAKAK